MTHTTHGRFWAAIGFLAFGSLWLVSAAANFHAGTALSQDEATQVVLGAASLSIDIAKAVLIFALVAAWHNRRLGVAIVSGLLLTLCFVWSYRAATNFAWAALMEAEAQAQRAEQVLEGAAVAQDLKSKRAAFLAQQKTVPTGKSNGSVRLALEANTATATEFKSLIRDLETSRPPDVSQQMLRRDAVAKLLEADPGKTALATSLFFAALLELASGFGFWVIAEARRRRQVVIEAPAPAVALQADPAPALVPPTLETQKAPSAPVQRQKRVLQPRAAPVAPPPNEIEALVAKFYEAADAQSRVLLTSIVGTVNAHLDEPKKISSPTRTSTVLVPAVERLGPQTQRVRAGGKVWIQGVKAKEEQAA